MKQIRCKWMKWLSYVTICLLALLMLPRVASARTAADPNKTTSLKVVCRYDGRALENVQFDVYKVAEMDAYGTYTVTSAFSAYPVVFEQNTQEKWRMLAETLSGYARRDGVATVAQGATDANGETLFSPLEVGLYLVYGHRYVDDEIIYLPEPFLVSLPSLDQDDNWLYDVTASSKGNATAITMVKVLKVWKDNGQEAVRPTEVTAQLLCDDAVHDEVILNEQNNWRHTWTELDASHVWRVVEKDIRAGYSVMIRQEGVTYVIENEATPCWIDPPIKKIVTGDKPQTPATFRFVMEAVSSTVFSDPADIPMPEGAVGGKKVKEIVGEQEFEFGIIQYMLPGTYVYRVYEENTGAPGYTYDTNEYTITCTVTENGNALTAKTQTTKGTEIVGEIVFTNPYETTKETPPPNATPTPKPKDPPLPSTGQLWWPVPILAVLGLLLLLVGIVRRKARHNDP